MASSSHSHDLNDRQPIVPTPNKDALLQLFKGKNVSQIQTPHLVIDRSIYVQNCQRMQKSVEKLGWDFRAHIKTHKTPEGARLQCEATSTSRIVVSTLPELMPLPVNLFPELIHSKKMLEQYNARLRVMVDHPSQIQQLEKALAAQGEKGVWSIFLKLDIGTKRAGLPPDSAAMDLLIKTAAQSPHVSIFGTYTHASFSYTSKSGQTAADYLALEVASANNVAKRVLQVLKEVGAGPEKLEEGGLRLAVGATPTAHAAHGEWEEARARAGVAQGQLVGKVELHAGNYCLLDYQQVATTLVGLPDCAMTVGATVLSTYEERNEAVCDAGAICMSKDTGPIPGFGPVVSPESLDGWSLGRNSQEHGILVGQGALPEIGQYVRIVPQHACLTAAQHPWFLIVDGDTKVQDYNALTKLSYATIEIPNRGAYCIYKLTSNLEDSGHANRTCIRQSGPGVVPSAHEGMADIVHSTLTVPSQSRSRDDTAYATVTAASPATLAQRAKTDIVASQAVLEKVIHSATAFHCNASGTVDLLWIKKDMPRETLLDPDVGYWRKVAGPAAQHEQDECQKIETTDQSFLTSSSSASRQRTAFATLGPQ
ncbi:hypothetical protein EMMF5_000360 [Cystobasidiomycetes sp. EMM_F5]